MNMSRRGGGHDSKILTGHQSHYIKLLHHNFCIAIKIELIIVSLIIDGVFIDRIQKLTNYV